MSDNKRAWWDNSNAYRLGYKPRTGRRILRPRSAAIDPGPSGDARVDLHQGGVFCVSEVDYEVDSLPRIESALGNTSLTFLLRGVPVLLRLMVSLDFGGESVRGMAIE